MEQEHSARKSNPTAKPHISLRRHNCNFIPLDCIYTCDAKGYLAIGRGKTPREAYIDWSKILYLFKRPL